MIGTKRFNKRIRVGTFRFVNPFRSTGTTFNTLEPKEFSSDIVRDGITSVERAEQQRKDFRKLQAMNAGINYDPETDATESDTNMQSALGKLANLSSSMGMNLPGGVASVAEAEKKMNMMRQLQRYNANILTPKEEQLKKLYKLSKKRKEQEQKQKAIQYLATSVEEQHIPTEFREEVANYYRGLKDSEWADLKAARRKELLASMASKRKEEAQKLTNDQLARWADNAIQDYLERTYRLAPDKMPKDEDELKRLQASTREFLFKGQKHPYEHFYETMDANTVDDQLKQMDEQYRGHGMKIKRLHTFVRPIYQKEENPTPEEEYETQQNEIEARRDEYKRKMREMRGKQPPREMIKRAMPSMAEPLEVIENIHPLYKKRRFII